MNGTMMRRGCHLQRMMEKAEFQEMIREDKKDVKDQRKAKPISWTDEMYEKIYEYILKEDQSVVRRDTVPVPRGGQVLSGWAHPVQAFECDGFKVTTTKPQNCVVAKISGKVCYGIVKQFYTFADHTGKQRSLVVLSPITNMYPKRTQGPTSRFRYYLYLFKAIMGQVDHTKALVGAPSDILSVAAYRLLPPNVFGIDNNGIVLVPYDHKALLDISGEI